MSTIQATPSKSLICPKKTALTAFAAGKLPQPEISEIEKHLAACDPCVETLVGLDQSDTLSDLTRDVMKRVSKDSKETGFVNSGVEDRLVVQRIAAQLKQFGGVHLIGTQADEIRANDLKQIEEIETLFESTPCESIGRFGSYRIDALLGCGSSSIVYLAQDLDLDRQVALKILRPLLGEKAKARFIHEARAIAAIDAPNVVAIYHVGKESSLAFIAMQWTPGETLQQRLQREQKLSIEEVKDLACQVCAGLSVAHDLNLIHRDIKPANLWIEESGVVKILDLGLVRLANTDLHLTGTGMIAGTPCYMSPEQARGAELDTRSDFFSLGCVLYEALTGQLPFNKENLLATIQAILIEEPTPVDEHRSDVPVALATLVGTLLAKESDCRPPSAQAIIQSLDSPVSQWPFTPTLNSDVDDQSETSVEVNQEAAVNKSKAIQSRGNWRFVRWAMAGVVVLGLAMAAWMSPQIIRVITDQGELVIETSDPDVKIEVIDEGGNVRVIDLKTNQAIEIKSGKYELQPHSDLNEIVLDKKVLTMSRGGRQVVKVTRVTKPKTDSEQLLAPKMMRDMREFADQVARDPGVLGIRGALNQRPKQDIKPGQVQVNGVNVDANQYFEFRRVKRNFLVNAEECQKLRIAMYSMMNVDDDGPQVYDDLNTFFRTSDTVVQSFRVRPHKQLLEHLKEATEWMSGFSARMKHVNQVATRHLDRIMVVRLAEKNAAYNLKLNIAQPAVEALSAELKRLRSRRGIPPEEGLAKLRSTKMNSSDSKWGQAFRGWLELDSMEWELAQNLGETSDDIESRRKIAKAKIEIRRFEGDIARNFSKWTRSQADQALHRSVTANQYLVEAESQFSILGAPERPLGSLIDYVGYCYDHETGLPIQNAKVRPFIEMGFGHMRQLEASNTDACGRFAVRNLKASDLMTPGRSLHVAISKAGYAYEAPVVFKRKSFQLVSSELSFYSKPVVAQRIPMKKGKELYGEVLDHEGQPIQDAEVFSFVFANRPVPDIGYAKTDARGKFALNDLQASGATQEGSSTRFLPLLIRQPGHGFCPVVLKDPKDKRLSYEFVMPKTCTVTSRVVDAETGQPVSGVGVQVCRPPASLEHAVVGSATWDTATSDKDGVVKFVLSKGSYNLKLWKNDESKFVGESVEFSVGEASSLRVNDIYLVKPVRVRGKVLNDDGSKVGEVAIGWYGPDNSFSPNGKPRLTWTDEDGFFTAYVHPGMNSFFVGAGSHTTQKLSVRRDGAWQEVESQDDGPKFGKSVNVTRAELRKHASKFGEGASWLELQVTSRHR